MYRVRVSGERIGWKICGLPLGYSFRFRFGLKWVAKCINTTHLG
jgi:hypothetical protein